MITLINSIDSYNIDQHDYDVRLRAAQNFLKDGDKDIFIFLLTSIPACTNSICWIFVFDSSIMFGYFRLKS
jgi:hypothetical protein